MQYSLNIFKLLLAAVFSLAIASCNGNDADQATQTITKIPDIIQKFTQTTTGTIQAWITIDGGTRTAMTIDSTAGTATATISGLTRASHTVLIEYEFTDGSNTVTLATATNTVDLSAGDSSIEFAGTDFDTSYDGDGDGITNTQELTAGTNPFGQPAFPEHCFPFDVSASYGDLAFDYDGNLLIAEYITNSIRVLNPTSCAVTTLTTITGQDLVSVVEDKYRDRVYAGSSSSNIYEINPNDGTSTLLVNAGAGYINSLVRAPSAYGSYGGQLIAGTSSGQILAIDQSQSSPTPTLIAIVGTAVSDVVFGGDNTLYVTDYYNAKIVTVAADGTLTDFATGVTQPEGLEIDNVGSRLFIAASGSPATLYVAEIPSGAVTPLRRMTFGGGFGTTGLARDINGSLLMHLGTSQIVSQPVRFSSVDTSCLPLSVDDIYGDITFISDGDLLVPNTGSGDLLRLDRTTCTTSTVATISGQNLMCVAEDPVRNRLYVGTGSTGNVYEVNPVTGASTLLVNLGSVEINAIVKAPANYGSYAGRLITADSGGNIYAVDQSVTSPTPVLIADIGSVASDLVFGSDGTLYVADFDSDKVVTVSVGGTLTDFATGMDGPDGLAMDNTGSRLFIASANDNTLSSAAIPSGTVTSLGSVNFRIGYYPSGIAFDGYSSLLMHTDSAEIDAFGLYPVTYGENTQLPDTVTWSPNYLYGQKITVSYDTTVSALGNYYVSAGLNTKFGLYSDVSGRPDTLLASTASFVSSAGRNEISTTNTLIPAGDYWFMSVSDSSQGIYRDTSVSNVETRYISHTFANALPTTWPVSDSQASNPGLYNRFIVGGALVP